MGNVRDCIETINCSIEGRRFSGVVCLPLRMLCSMFSYATRVIMLPSGFCRMSFVIIEAPVETDWVVLHFKQVTNKSEVSETGTLALHETQA